MLLRETLKTPVALERRPLQEADHPPLAATLFQQAHIGVSASFRPRGISQRDSDEAGHAGRDNLGANRSSGDPGDWCRRHRSVVCCLKGHARDRFAGRAHVSGAASVTDIRYCVID
jgi:hypothetical protein